MKPRVPKELIVNLFDCRAIIAGSTVTRHDGTEARFDLQLDGLVPTNRELRLELAKILGSELSRSINASQFGLVDVSPSMSRVVTTISNGIDGECQTA